MKIQLYKQKKKLTSKKKLIIVLYKNLNLLPLSILVEPSGAFLVIAFLIALFQKKGEKHESI